LCRSAVAGWRFSRFDPLSGREIGHTNAWNCNNGPITSGPGGMWLVDELGNLVRFDPLPPYRLRWWDEIFRFPIQPFLAVSYGRGVWLVDAGSRQLMWYEPATGHHRTLRFRADEVVVVEGVDPYTPERVWIVDPVASEVVPLGEGVEERRHRIPIVGSGYAWLEDPHGITNATSLDGKLWIALGSEVVAIPEDGSSLPTTVSMPREFEASWLISDGPSHTLWAAA
jgi:hypothetical protein